MIGTPAGGDGGPAKLMSVSELGQQLVGSGSVSGPGAPAGNGLPTGGAEGQVLAWLSGIATWSFTTLITAVGTIASGVWHGTKIGLAYGGTNADLSGTGGAGKFLKQASAGAAITVASVDYADLTGTPPSGGITQLTGDVTAGPGTGSQVATIASHAVTNAKAAQMAAHTFKGNNTGSTADAIDLTDTQATAELNVMVGDSGSGGTKGLAPAPGAGDAAAEKFLKADATYAVPVGTGPTTLAGDTDVSISGLADNDLLRYQTSDSKWHNVAKNTYTALITVLGTIATGVWQGTIISIGYGGTGSNLGATGGAHRFLRQNGTGQNIDVVQPDFSDLASTLGSHLIAGSNITLSGTTDITISSSAPGTGTVTSVAMTVPAALSVSGSPITTNGTLAISYNGNWPLAHGGTNADLSATGGASYVLKQSSVGAAITVGQLSYSDISGTPPGSSSPDWDEPLIGGWADGGWADGGWADVWFAWEAPGISAQVLKTQGASAAPSYWSWVKVGELTPTATNDNAGAGQLGEYASSTVAASGVSLTNATPVNVTNVSLTAGDWDVTGVIDYVTSGATTSDFKSGVSSTSATFGAQDSFANMPLIATALSDTFGHVLPTVRISLAATTTIYLVAQASFSLGTSSAYGTIRARRVR